MSLKFAILGFLDMMPLSGYDLKKMFDATVKFFWSATHTQIYRTLNQMLDEKLVDQEIVQQTYHPNKKLYHITPDGEKELLRWLVTAVDIPPVRHKLLVKITLADRIDTEKIIDLLNDYCGKLRERLSLYKSKNVHINEEYARSEREKFLWDAVLDNGFASYECELKWAEETAEGLKKFL